MKKKIINGLLFAVVLVAATSSFVSCKDYDGYNELQEKYLTLQDAFNKQVKAMEDFVLTSKYESEVGANYDKAKGTIKDRLDEIEKDLDPNVPGSLAEQVVKNEQTILYVTALAKADSARSWNDSIRIDNLVSAMTNAWGDNLAEAMQKAAKVAATVAADSDAWNKAVEVADSAWNWIKSGKDAKDLEYKNLAEMIKDFKDADKALEDQINALKQDVNNILALVQQQVTGIEIQATHNPIFGSFAYPIDVQSNILAVYYGEFQTNVVFPAGDGETADFWVDPAAPAVLTSELQAINAPSKTFAKGIQMKEGAGNAGKLYLTVNPSDVIMDGKEFTLRTSDNQVSKVVLSPLATCTEQLKWGYNRAAENSPNGFYVATAEIKKDNAKDVALNFNLKTIAKDLQNVMQDWSSVSAADIVKLLWAVADGMKVDAPRLGVQAQWKDTLGWKNYVSKYDLAAFSVQPVGYDFLINNDGTSMDFSGGVVKFHNKIVAKEKAFAQDLINQIAQALAFSLKLPVTTETNIEIDAAGNVYVVIPNKSISNGTTVIVSAGSWGGIYPTTDIKLPILPNVTGETGYKINITPLITALNTAINTQLGKVNTTVDTEVNKILNKIINFENKIFGKVESVLKNPNRYVQPALVAKCEQLGYFYPSRIFTAPTQVKKGTKIMFYPTTLTGEVVAPAFKKYVAVTGAWNVADISEDRGAAQFNTGVLNTIFDGDTYNLQKPIEYTVNAPAGTVLEFVFECLGYNGKVAGKKYYIEVYE